MATKNPQAENDNIDERLKKTVRELKSLGDCEGVPTDTSELSEMERTRFDQLKEKLIYQKKMKEVNETEIA